MMLSFLLALSLMASPAPAEAHTLQPPDYLYKVTLVRAAPGKLLDLIALYQAQAPRYEAQGDAAPLWMRHSQGDHWDLMLIFPMESYPAYYHPERLAQRAAQAEAQAAFDETFGQVAAWTEDLFVYGPSFEEVQARYEGAGLFHVEMFKALPGKHDELIAQREMENRYYAGLGHPGNLVFIRDQGGAIDCFTLGFYRDMHHFAENGDFSFEEEDQAAKAAGFEGVTMISPYLRSLIAYHHDTLAVAIR